jgi:hypothetical protein
MPPLDLAAARPWRRKLETVLVEAGRHGLQVAVGAAVLFGFWTAQFLVTSLSTHLSFKPALESYAKYARNGERFGRYRIEGKGTAFYSGVSMVDLATQDRVVSFLRDNQRVFALVSADELGTLDSAFKSNQVGYYVVNAASSRFLLLSNRLDAGETDENPLRKNVWMAPTPPSANGNTWNAAEKPPWTWRVQMPGEYVRDTFDIDAPLMTTPAGTYRIFVGFWPGGEAKRLKMTAGTNDGSDRLYVGSVQIN